MTAAMRELTSKFTARQLTDMGRAMERSGHVELKDYLHWASLAKTREIIAPQQQDVSAEQPEPTEEE